MHATTGQQATARQQMRRRRIPIAALFCLLAMSRVLWLAGEPPSATGAAGAPSYPFFRHATAQARCLIQRCDPYSEAALNAAASARDQPLPPRGPVFLPSAFVFLLPFSFGSATAHGYGFTLLGGFALALAIAGSVAGFGIGRGGMAALVILFVLASPALKSMVGEGNPALLSLACAVAATLLMVGTPDGDLPRGRRVGWLLLGLGLATKPQLSLGTAVFLLWRPESRRAAWKAILLFLALVALAGLLYWIRLGSPAFMVHGVEAWTAAQHTGGLADPSPANANSWSFLNLQALLRRLPFLTALLADVVAWTVAIVCKLAWSVARHHHAVELRPWTMVAVLVAISLLPLTHRASDATMLLMMLPAVVEIGDRDRSAAWLLTGLLCFWTVLDECTVAGHNWQKTVPANSIVVLAVIGVLLWSLRQGNGALGPWPVMLRGSWHALRSHMGWLRTRTSRVAAGEA